MFKVRLLEAKTLSWRYSERDNIDFSPSYQRRSKLWSVKDKAFLIDSILNDYDIPKIYLADFTYGNSPLNVVNKSYSIIDGKQRFEALFDFFDNKIVLDTDFKLNSDHNLKLANLSYKDLKSLYPKLAIKFENYNLTVMGVQTDEENLINDLFVRLNRGKPLTGAEIRSAMGGVVPPLIDKITKHEFFNSNIKFSKSRKQDYNVAAKLLLLEFRGNFVDMKKIHLDRFVDEGFEVQNVNFEFASNKVLETLNLMHQSFSIQDPLLKSSGIITPYYWLYRNYNKNVKVIRDFLVSFNDERERNKSIIKNELKETPDDDVIKFEQFIRNPNDQGSLIKVYSILENKFHEYLKDR